MTIHQLAQFKSQGYSDDQMAEIEEGLAHGLDVSVYADKDYFAIQMRQIRLGMEEGLDVSVYASRSYDWFQMEEIRLGMSQGIDVSYIAKPEYSYEVMRELRAALADGIRLDRYVYVGAELMRELHKALLDRQNIIPYVKEGYAPEQIGEIRYALKNGCNIDAYLDKSYRGAAIRELRKGLERGLDVSLYAKPEYSWQQMREIRLGLEKRLDVSMYAKELYSWQQMREIRLGIEQQLSVDEYRSMVFSAEDMRRKRLELLKARRAFDNTVLSDSAAPPVIDELRETVFKIIKSGDCMRAYVYVGSDAISLTKDGLLAELDRQGIVKGIDEEILCELANGRHRGELVVVASGMRAVNGTDGFYEYCAGNDIQRLPEILSDGSADYSNVKWFVGVSKGQRLAVYHMAGKGSDGYTVEGNVIHGDNGQEIKPLYGRGFCILDDGVTYVASESGCLAINGNELSVTGLLEIEDVSSITGNVSFDGSLHIRGDVSGGIEINASGDVVVDGFVENAFIRCGGNMLLKKGANGQGTGILSAGGDIQGRFFENICISAGKIASNYYFRCRLEASESVTAYGTNGSLAGGSVYAADFISVGCLGNRAGIDTNVQLGIRRDMEDKSISGELREVDSQLLILTNALEDYRRKYPPEQRNAMEIFLKIENAVYTKRLEKNKLLAKLERLERRRKRADKAYLKVSGRLYEGCLIRINDASYSGGLMESVVMRNSLQHMTISHI